MSKESETNLTSLQVDFFFDLVPTPLMTLDRSGVISRVNSCALALLGYDRSDLIGHSLVEIALVQAGSRSDSLGALVECPSDETFQVELFLRHKDSRALATVLRLYPVVIEGDGCFVASLTEQTIDNGTNLKAKLERLERNNRDLQRFAYAVAHELRRPLTVLKASCHQIQRAPADPKLLSTAAASLEEMGEILRGLLESSVTSNGTRPRSLLPLSDIVEKSVLSLSSLRSETGGEVKCKALPVVHGDRCQLTILFRNLIENGLKFHRDVPPEVTISAERHGSMYLFAVRDNGIGVASDDYSKLFTMFHRLQPNEFPGTGIGLAMIKQIVEDHGGKIWIESTPGKGTTFFFTLPAVSPLTQKGIEHGAFAAL